MPTYTVVTPNAVLEVEGDHSPGVILWSVVAAYDHEPDEVWVYDEKHMLLDCGPHAQGRGIGSSLSDNHPNVEVVD